ncbi:MAG: hypothetical protein J6A09_00080 [Alphaproteobacteria bacterium]|nr:hypothetical protein [Alphaproteobacteria bacterium]
MQYLTLNTFFFAELIIISITLLSFALRLRLRAYEKQTTLKILQTFRKKELPFFYSSGTIKQECRQTFFHLRPHLTLKLERHAMKNLNQAAKKVRFSLKKSPQNLRLQLLDAELSQLLEQKSDFTHLIENIVLPVFTPRALKAKYNYLKALNELYQTDMSSASYHLSSALKSYKKLNYLYEEAECYAALGHIYRITGVFDVADTMYREAQKIYTTLNLTAKIAETEAYLGIIEISRENYNQAQKYLKTAANIAQTNNLTKTLADINNRQGLAAFLNQDHKTAEKFYNNALKNGTPQAQAFAAEMLSKIMLKTNRPDKALKYADIALNLNQTLNHRAGIFETLYLKAEIFYLKENYNQAKKILTSLIQEKTPPSTLYYPANAYTMLGLIELKQNNLNKAKTLIKQALDLEHAKNRLKGAAIDYGNLAQIALLEKDEATAKTYLEQALAYAKTIDDQELITTLSLKANPQDILQSQK